MKKETQNKRLLSHLEQGKRVNPLTAWNELGIYRLSARIFDLRDAGYPVDDKRIEVQNKFGEKVNVKEYFLV